MRHRRDRRSGRQAAGPAQARCRPWPRPCFIAAPTRTASSSNPGLGLASRRLSIVGLADGRQPITNEDGSVSVVFNGELFDYPEMRGRLEGRGHRFATHCDTELIPHLWEDHGEGMFEHLRGQFALALWDQRQRRLILARDRFGICPLFWTRQGRLAAVRLGDQGPAGLRPGAGPAGSCAASTTSSPSSPCRGR